ncbi:hypothetical protein J3E71DRAFT_242660 [Bipolaris maydis]|nr:hypothetical protein J3E71DRAFT_242660 [Bipolaris maydis]
MPHRARLLSCVCVCVCVCVWPRFGPMPKLQSRAAMSPLQFTLVDAAEPCPAEPSDVAVAIDKGLARGRSAPDSALVELSDSPSRSHLRQSKDCRRNKPGGA